MLVTKAWRLPSWVVEGRRAELGQGLARLLDRPAARRDAVEDQRQPCASPWRPARPWPGSPRCRASSAGPAPGRGRRRGSRPWRRSRCAAGCRPGSGRPRACSRSSSTPSRQPPIIEKRSSGASRWRCSRRRIQPVRLPCGSMSTRRHPPARAPPGPWRAGSPGSSCPPRPSAGPPSPRCHAVSIPPSVAARPVDQVAQGQPVAQPAQIVGHRVGRALRVGEARHVRRHVDQRMAPERVAGRQRLLGEAVQAGMGEPGRNPGPPAGRASTRCAPRPTLISRAPAGRPASSRASGCRGSRRSAAAGRPGRRVPARNAASPSAPGEARARPASRLALRLQPRTVKPCARSTPRRVPAELAQAHDPDAGRPGRLAAGRSSSAPARCSRANRSSRRWYLSTRVSTNSPILRAIEGRPAGTGARRAGRVGQQRVDARTQGQDQPQVGQAAQDARRHAPDQRRLDRGRVADLRPDAGPRARASALQRLAPGLRVLVRAVEQERHRRRLQGHASRALSPVCRTTGKRAATRTGQPAAMPPGAGQPSRRTACARLNRPFSPTGLVWLRPPSGRQRRSTPNPWPRPGSPTRAPDHPTVLLAHPQAERLRAVARRSPASTGSRSTGDGGAAFERLACGRCQPGAGRHGAARPERPRGAAAARRARPAAAARWCWRSVPRTMSGCRSSRTHGFADAIQELPCPDGVLLRTVWAPARPRRRAALGAAAAPAQGAGPHHPQAARRRPAAPSPAAASSPPTRSRAAGQPGGRGAVRPADGRRAGRAAAPPRLHLRPLASGSPPTSPPSRSPPACAGTTPSSWPRPGCCTTSARPRSRSASWTSRGRSTAASGTWCSATRVIAADVLQRSPALPAHLVRIAERHHERLDGSGYPHGLRRRRDRRAQPALRHRRRAHRADRPPRLPQPARRGGRFRPDAARWPGRSSSRRLLSRYEAVMLDQPPPRPAAVLADRP